MWQLKLQLKLKKDFFLFQKHLLKNMTKESSLFFRYNNGGVVMLKRYTLKCLMEEIYMEFVS